uniref:Uncharacterized protein n=1 Tax=Lactuca sativa TaxID=4236 RepID=A0A9R1WUG6_LACSA|nr:hypothetical protein LSAT_V11C800424750 [Lactuca sativa]
MSCRARNMPGCRFVFLASRMYQRCSQHERIVSILDDYLRKNPKDVALSVVHVLASTHMLGNAHDKALHHIEYAQHNYSAAKDLPAFFGVFTHETVNDYSHLIIEAADSLMTVKHHAYLMLEGNDGVNKNVFSSESHRDKINGKSTGGPINVIY